MCACVEAFRGMGEEEKSIALQALVRVCSENHLRELDALVKYGLSLAFSLSFALSLAFLLLSLSPLLSLSV